MSKIITVDDLMKDKTPSVDYAGYTIADDYILAIDISGNPDTLPNDYAVVRTAFSTLESSLNSITVDKQYFGEGQSTTKTGTQRTFAMGGDRKIGDGAQDFILSHKIKYGTGNTVVVPYVYFNMLTGIGEKGLLSIIVNNDGSGSAGESAAIDVQFSKIGEMPEEYTYEKKSTTKASELKNNKLNEI